MMPMIIYWSRLSVIPPIVFSTLWPDLVNICDLWPDPMHRVTQECSIPPGTTGKTRRFGWKQHFVKWKIIPRRPRVLAMVGRCKLSFEQTTIKRLNKREWVPSFATNHGCSSSLAIDGQIRTREIPGGKWKHKSTRVMTTLIYRWMGWISWASASKLGGPEAWGRLSQHA